MRVVRAMENLSKHTCYPRRCKRCVVVPFYIYSSIVLIIIIIGEISKKRKEREKIKKGDNK